MTRPKPGIPRKAIYPPLAAVAFVFSQYGVSNVPVEALPRPAIVALVLGPTLYLVASALLASLDRGAFVALVVLFVLMGLAEVALLLVGWFLVAVVIAVRKGNSLRTIPWLRATRIRNGVAAILLIGTVVATSLEGAFNSPAAVPGQLEERPNLARPTCISSCSTATRAPIPWRRVRLRQQPIPGSMEAMGFDVAAQSHSNYERRSSRSRR